MRRGLRWVLAVAVLALAATTGVVVMSRRDEPIGPRGYFRIRLGMTRGQVRAAIGLPPDCYYAGSTEGGRPFWVMDEWGTRAATAIGAGVADEWGNERYVLAVVYDAEGCVAGCTLVQVGPGDPLDRFVWRARRQWRRWFPEG